METHLRSALPASDQQRYFWFLQQMSPDSPLVNVVATLHVAVGLEPDEVRDAFRAVVARHSTLRSLLVAQGGELLQVPFDADLAPFAVHDVPDLDGARERACAEAHHVFDLEREPPVRCFLYRIPGGESMVVLVCQHAAVDRSSVEIVSRDLIAALERRLGPAFDHRLDYPDYVRAQQNEHATGDAVQWWADRLSAIELEPTDPSPRPVAHAILDVTELMSRARAAAASLGLMPGTALLAALLNLLGRDRDLLVGLVVANRVRPEYAEVVGPLARLVPLPVCRPGGESLEAVSRRLHADLGAALARQEVPIDRLADEVRRRGTSFQFPSIVFNLVSAKTLPPTLRGSPVTFDVDEIGEESAHADLVAVVWPDEVWRAAIDIRVGGRFAGYSPSSLVDAWAAQFPETAR